MARRSKRRTNRDNTRGQSGPQAAALTLPLPPVRRWMMAAIVVAAVLAFVAAAKAPFQFDDIDSIARNPTIQRLWPLTVPLDPPPYASVSGRPVVNYSFALNYALNRALGVDQRVDPDGPLKTVSYHLANILLHVLNGLMLFGIIRRTLHQLRTPDAWAGAADDVATAVALLWLLHPIQTEAVDYVVQRTELLVSAFYLATLYASIRAWDAPTDRARVRWYAASFVACLLGMGSKEVMASAPVAVILYDRAFRTTSWRALRSQHPDRLWFYGALVLAAVPLVIAVASGARSDSVGFQHGIPWYQYLYSQAWAILHYLTLVLWPAGLTYDYGQTPIFGPGAFVGAVVLTALAIATVVAWGRAPRMAFLGTAFFMLLAPSSSIIPIRTEIAAERRMYLALAPVLVLAVLGAVAVVRRVAAARPEGQRRAFATAVIGMSALLFVATAARSAVYENPEALWRDAISKMPANPRAYDNLAAVVLRKDSTHLEEAEQLLRRAIAIDSTYITGWTNLADIVFARDSLPEARALLEHALRINPDAIDATRRLGGLLVKLGDDEHAIPYLERVNAVLPSDESLALLGLAYLGVGRRNDAANALRRAIAINPTRLDAISYLGALLSDDGRPDEALGYLEPAARDPSASAMTFGLLSLTDAQLGHVEQAVAAATAASARAGNDARVFSVLGRAMILARRLGDAETYLVRAVQLAPRDPEPLTRLGILKAALGHEDEAAHLFHKALTIEPGYEPAQQAIAKLGRTARP